MLRDLRETALQSAHGQLIFPRYDGFSFANIPDTVLALFGVDSGRPLLDEVVLEPMKPWKFEHVLVVLIDGLGFNQWTDRAVKHPFFRRLGESGSVTSLTAVFP